MQAMSSHELNLCKGTLTAPKKKGEQKKNLAHFRKLERILVVLVDAGE
jgi:hypothetical protein